MWYQEWIFFIKGSLKPKPLTSTETSRPKKFIQMSATDEFKTLHLKIFCWLWERYRKKMLKMISRSRSKVDKIYFFHINNDIISIQLSVLSKKIVWKCSNSWTNILTIFCWLFQLSHIKSLLKSQIGLLTPEYLTNE